MSSPKDPKEQLSFEEAKQFLLDIFGKSDEPVLIGGQAIEFWCQYYGIPSELPCITSDIDFYGDATLAEEGYEALQGNRELLINIAEPDDASPNSAVITFRSKSDKPIKIDYLYQVTGLSNDDIESFSPQVIFEGITLKVLHPLLCLESKVNNLVIHPLKRNAEGQEQARLSVQIARCYLEKMIETEGVKSTYDLAERIGRFSLREPAHYAWHQYHIDTLGAIPIEKYPDNEFKTIRYPQIKSQVMVKREKYDKLMEKRKELYGNLGSRRFSLR
jgi:hypothetical protein